MMIHKIALKNLSIKIEALQLQGIITEGVYKSMKADIDTLDQFFDVSVKVINRIAPDNGFRIFSPDGPFRPITLEPDGIPPMSPMFNIDQDGSPQTFTIGDMKAKLEHLAPEIEKPKECCTPIDEIHNSDETII